MRVDCAEFSFLVVFFQLQVQLQTTVPQPDMDGTNGSNGMDDIDAALTDLQVSLEGSSVSGPGDITHIPELQDQLRFFKYVTQ